MKSQALGHCRSYHHQSRYELRTYRSIDVEVPAFELLPGNLQWEKSFFVEAFNVGTESAKRVNKNTHGALTHTFAAVDSGIHSFTRANICRYEASCRTGSSGIYFNISIGIVYCAESRSQQISIIAIGDLSRQSGSGSQRIDD